MLGIPKQKWTNHMMPESSTGITPIIWKRMEDNQTKFSPIIRMSVKMSSFFTFAKFMTYLRSGGPFIGHLDAAVVPVKCSYSTMFTPISSVSSTFPCPSGMERWFEMSSWYETKDISTATGRSLRPFVMSIGLIKTLSRISPDLLLSSVARLVCIGLSPLVSKLAKLAKLVNMFFVGLGRGICEPAF